MYECDVCGTVFVPSPESAIDEIECPDCGEVPAECIIGLQVVLDSDLASMPED